MTRAPLHNFRGQSAVILVRSPEIGARIKARCDRLGVTSHVQSTDLDGDTAAAADILVIDIDTADDAMLPWPRGAAPMPMIGLIGSESPGRLAWALAQEIDAFLPVAGLGNLFSAMVIAHETFARKAARAARDADAARRRGGRLDVIRAVLSLMQDGRDEALALKQLRAMAMVDQVSLEEAAATLLRERPADPGKRA